MTDVARWARAWARTWERAWPAGDVEAIVALHAEHGDHWASIRRRHQGRDGLRAHLAECFAGQERPAEVWFGEPVASGARATVEYWAVTYADGRPCTVAGCTVLLFDGDGLVVESRDYSHAEPGRVRPPGDRFLPEHLRPSVEMLRRAFPQGLPEPDYRPLLAALYEDFSDRNLAAVVAAFTGGDPLRVGNDAAGLGGERPAPGDVTRVREALLRAGWEPDDG